MVALTVRFLTVRFLPATERHGGRFDVAGALLATAGSTALVFGIVDATDIGWTAPATLVPLVAGLVMPALFRSKREAAAALGADRYAVTGDASAFTELADTFDIILNTASAPVSLPHQLGMLRLHGTMVNVGVTTEPMPMEVFALLQNGRSSADRGSSPPTSAAGS